MSTIIPAPFSTTWTAGDLVERFGDIPLDRVVVDPPPGTATVADVVRLDDQEDMLCELIDGTLVRKAMGIWESILAVRLATMLSEFVERRRLGVVAGEGGTLEIFEEHVRIPDVAFISNDRLSRANIENVAVPHVAPDLAVEIISRSNTRREMERKLADYFAAGVRLAWYVYPAEKQVVVYTAVDRSTTLGETDRLEGGDVLPGFAFELKPFFAPPTP
jgi:Uma2 family endonuclease